MLFKQIILTTTCLFTATLAMAELPQDSRRAGGIAVIPLTADITQVNFQQKPVLISQEGHQRYAVFGSLYLHLLVLYSLKPIKPQFK
jgi:hypothetical protein